MCLDVLFIPWKPRNVTSISQTCPSAMWCFSHVFGVTLVTDSQYCRFVELLCLVMCCLRFRICWLAAWLLSEELAVHVRYAFYHILLNFGNIPQLRANTETINALNVCAKPKCGAPL